MSSLSSNPLSNSNNDGHGDQSTHNTLRKDPVSRQTPSSSKLIKSRTGAADNDASLDPAANSQQQQGPISRTNRLRKALGVGSSNVGVDSSQNHSGQSLSILPLCEIPVRFYFQSLQSCFISIFDRLLAPHHSAFPFPPPLMVANRALV